MRTPSHPHLHTLEDKHRALHAQVDAEEARPAPDTTKLRALKRQRLEAKTAMHSFANSLEMEGARD